MKSKLIREKLVEIHATFDEIKALQNKGKTVPQIYLSRVRDTVHQMNDIIDRDVKARIAAGTLDNRFVEVWKHFPDLTSH